MPTFCPNMVPKPNQPQTSIRHPKQLGTKYSSWVPKHLNISLVRFPKHPMLSRRRRQLWSQYLRRWRHRYRTRSLCCCLPHLLGVSGIARKTHFFYWFLLPEKPWTWGYSQDIGIWMGQILAHTSHVCSRPAYSTRWTRVVLKKTK